MPVNLSMYKKQVPNVTAASFRTKELYDRWKFSMLKLYIPFVTKTVIVIA